MATAVKKRRAEWRETHAVPAELLAPIRRVQSAQRSTDNQALCTFGAIAADIGILAEGISHNVSLAFKAATALTAVGSFLNLRSLARRSGANNKAYFAAMDSAGAYGYDYKRLTDALRGRDYGAWYEQDRAAAKQRRAAEAEVRRRNLWVAKQLKLFERAREREPTKRSCDQERDPRWDDVTDPSGRLRAEERLQRIIPGRGGPTCLDQYA